MDGDRSSESFQARMAPVAELLTEAGTIRPIVINEAENALYWLYKRNMVSAEQFVAGERLREDYTGAHLEARTTADWDREVDRQKGGRRDVTVLTDAALAARLRFHKAINAVGPELASILLEVCCLSAGLEQAERRLSMPIRSGKVVLGLALTRLARHYGLLQPEPPARCSSATRHWAMPGYKPEIS